MRETVGQPLMLRWAKALEHYAQKAPVTIFPDELIVGRPNTWLGRWALIYPEVDGSAMAAGVAMFRANKGKPGDVTVTAEDEKIIDELLAPYWAGKDYATNFFRELPEDTRFRILGPDPKNNLLYTCVVLATSPMRHSQNWTPDFTKILTRGVKGIREETQAKLAALREPRDWSRRKPEAVRHLRRADHVGAPLLAAGGGNGGGGPMRRRKELEQIAAACAWVPENPARTFQEALQSQWFMQMFSRLEQNIGGQVSQGRWTSTSFRTTRRTSPRAV
jgi:formate C-acetyltransferase